MKSKYNTNEFWVKIHMDDGAWSDMDSKTLDYVDAFEKYINSDLWDKFLEFIKTSPALKKIDKCGFCRGKGSVRIGASIHEPCRHCNGSGWGKS